MKTRKNACIVVDAYSTGNTLAGIFTAYGYSTIHIQSGDNIPANIKKSFKPETFIENIFYEGNIESLLKKISSQNYHIKCVVAGAESGVELADILSEQLNLMTNGTELSRARRNKFIMTETIRKKGLNSIDQIKSNNLAEIIKWVSNKNIFPKLVVLKPLESSSTDGFHICRNEDELITAFNQLHLSKDVFGNINNEILVQNYIDGQEYCVNTVSHDGKHYISDIWEINKKVNGFSKIYDLDQLADLNDKTYDDLKIYALKVLDALGIKYGPSHTEIIVTLEGRPTLVESAARLMGSLDLSLVTNAYGTNAAMLTVESYLAPEQFLSRINQQPTPQMKSHAYMVQLISKSEGILNDYSLNNLTSLQTFYGFDAYFKSGDLVKQTIDTVSSPGLVFLSDAKKENLDKDYKSLRKLEEKGLIYKFSPSQNYHSLATERNVQAESKNIIDRIKPANTFHKIYSISDLPTLMNKNNVNSYNANSHNSEQQHQSYQLNKG